MTSSENRERLLYALWAWGMIFLLLGTAAMLATALMGALTGPLLVKHLIGVGLAIALFRVVKPKENS